MWTYNTYRATLILDGKPFAIVTPDGRGALGIAQQDTLLGALNGGLQEPAKPVPSPRSGPKPRKVKRNHVKRSNRSSRR